MNLNDRYYGDGTIWQRKDGTGWVEILRDLPEWMDEEWFLVSSNRRKTYAIRRATLDRRYTI